MGCSMLPVCKNQRYDRTTARAADNGQKYAQNNFDGTYTVFGEVIAGQDVVDAIANAPAVANPAMNGEVSQPVHPVSIIHATILSGGI